MRKLIIIIYCLFMICINNGCSNTFSFQEPKDLHVQSEENYDDGSNEVKNKVNSDDESNMIPIYVKIQDNVFTAQFYNNEMTQKLVEKFPITIKMTELNGNEKCYEFDENITNLRGEKPGLIKAGDIMIWSGNYLVLFYDTFSNHYGGYNAVGSIEDTERLAEVLGNKDIEVTFSLTK